MVASEGFTQGPYTVTVSKEKIQYIHAIDPVLSASQDERYTIGRALYYKQDLGVTLTQELSISPVSTISDDNENHT